MVLITTVNGAYKPTYNWGAPHCRDIYIPKNGIWRNHIGWQWRTDGWLVARRFLLPGYWGLWPHMNGKPFSTNEYFVRWKSRSVENGPFTDDFPIKISIYHRCSIAILNYQTVTKLMMWVCVWKCDRSSEKETSKHVLIQKNFIINPRIYGYPIFRQSHLDLMPTLD